MIRLLQLYSNVRHVPCSAHSLNLVSIHDAQVDEFGANAFRTIQNLLTYLRKSIHCWDVLKRYVTMTIK